MRLTLPETADWPFAGRHEVTADEFNAFLRGEAIPLPPAEHATRKRRGDRKANGNTYEADWSETVYQAAKRRRWFAYRVLNSKGSTPGVPDLWLMRPPRMVYAELKDETEPPTAAQVACMALLRLYPWVEVYLFRPQDWDEVERILM